MYNMGRLIVITGNLKHRYISLLCKIKNENVRCLLFLYILISINMGSVVYTITSIHNYPQFYI